MLFYLLLPITNILIYLLLNKFKISKKGYLIVSFTILFLISTLRSEYIGADYNVYVEYFDKIQFDFKYIPTEIGFRLFNYIISLFTKNYVIFTLIINTFVFYTIYKYIVKNVDEKYYIWIMVIFIMNPYLYIQSTFNIIRQTIAYVIILCGLKYLIEKNFIKYLLIIILAAQIHTVSYIFILLILLRLIKWNQKKLAMLLVGVVTIRIFKNCGILDIVANFLGYGIYINYKSTMFDFSLFYMFILSIIIMLIVNYNEFKLKENQMFFINLYIISLILLPLFVTNDIIYRVYIGLVLLSLPAIPLIFETFENKYKRIGNLIKIGFVSYYSLLFVFFLYTLSRANNIYYIPFKFFWQ